MSEQDDAEVEHSNPQLPNRIVYGKETEFQIYDGPMLYVPRQSETCLDCNVEKGEMHKPGCDVEQCPICSQQLISCGHFSWVVREGNCHECGEYVDYGIDEKNTLRCKNCRAVVSFEDPKIDAWFEECNDER